MSGPKKITLIEALRHLPHEECHDAAKELEALRAENEGLRLTLSRRGKSVAPEMVALRAENERLRRALDDIKVQGWERGQMHFHDMALAALKEGQDDD